MRRPAQVLNEARTTPFYINEDVEVDEALRLKYRYLDLRRPAMQKNIILRHQVVNLIRDYMNDHGFLEIETPILIKTTPEGARDYVVPSRVHPGQVLRAAAVAAAAQAAAHGGRLRAVLPDRPLLPRRRPARRPPAGVHPARRRDELHRARGHHRVDQRAIYADHRAVGHQADSAKTLPRAHLRGSDGQVRLGQARPAVRDGARRPERASGEQLLQRVLGGRCRRR